MSAGRQIQPTPTPPLHLYRKRVAVLTIRHTRAEGTVVEGTSYGDGTNTILAGRDGLGLRWDGDNERWYQRRSRRRSADQRLIGTAEARLKAAGHQVEVTIDNTTPAPSFAEHEAESYERADRRAEARNQWADSATASSNAAYAKVRQIAEGIPFGQPILVGHHSEARARRDQRRMHEGMRKSIDEGKRATYHADRARAAELYQRRRENVPTTLRRIETIEARLRAIARELDGRRSYEGAHIPCPPSRAAELQAENIELADELAYWRAHVEARQAEGVKVWQRSDFQRGDFVRRSGTWFQVLRVNSKSVTIPALVSSRQRRGPRRGRLQLDPSPQVRRDPRPPKRTGDEPCRSPRAAR